VLKYVYLFSTHFSLVFIPHIVNLSTSVGDSGPPFLPPALLSPDRATCAVDSEI